MTFERRSGCFMEFMTPEERFTKIENLLAALTESQVRHDAIIDKQSAAIEKQHEGLQQLVLVSRTLIDSQLKVTAQISALSAEIDKLKDRQQATDDKLHALIETVDRIIRGKI